MEARLKEAKSNKDAVSPEQSEKIAKGYQETVKQWRKRKRMVRSRGRGWPWTQCL